MKYTSKINKTYVSKEELEQLLEMFKWATNNDDALAISFKMFKQYDIKKKEYNTVYEVWCQEFSDNGHKSAMGNGGTTIDAMAAFSQKYQTMKEIEMKLK